MIADEELDKIIEEREKQEIVTVEETNNIVQPSEFSQAMDVVKENVLTDASSNDEKFVKTIKENVKDAAVKYTEVEQEKANLSKQQVIYEQEKLSTAQKRNENDALVDKWENKRQRRQYHFDGVKPIMNFVNITDPLNLPLLYFLTTFLTPIYLFIKFCKGTIGTVIAGASDSDRPKAVKGFLWTLIAVIATLLLAAGVYLFLKWQKII